MDDKEIYKKGKLVYITNGKSTGVYYCDEAGKLWRFMWKYWNNLFVLDEEGYINGDVLYVHLKLGRELGLYSDGDYPPYQEIFF